jgi:hypothetical protein
VNFGKTRRVDREGRTLRLQILAEGVSSSLLLVPFHS